MYNHSGIDNLFHDSAPVNKMAAMPKYGKKYLEIFSRTKKVLRLYWVYI